MHNEYEIEIIEINLIEWGLEVFLRAWKNGVQLGFGKEGTIDIERFKILNPPILVDDPLGEISKEIIYQDGTVHQRNLREDPEESIVQSLIHTVSLTGVEGTTIVPGSRGNTTSTFYPSMDGQTLRRNNDAAWSTARSAADANSASTSDEAIYFLAEQRTGPTRYDISRLFFVFNTSALTGESISAATFSLAEGGDKSSPVAAGLVQITPASDSALEVGDYDAFTLNSPTEGTASRPTWNGGTNAYTNWTMNSTGIGWISTSGNTKLGLRMGNDIDDSAPAGRCYVQCYGSEAAGTSLDPKLVVVHAAASSGPTNLKSLDTNLKANIKSINTNAIANVKSVNTNS